MSKEVLNGKNCLLTGASGGIGKEIAKQLVKNNCNIFLTSRTKNNLEKLVLELESINHNVKISYFPSDISNMDGITNPEEAKFEIGIIRQQLKKITLMSKLAKNYEKDCKQKILEFKSNLPNKYFESDYS